MNTERAQILADSRPELAIIETIQEKLSPLVNQVLLGYAAKGVDDQLQPPTILIQLASISEESQQGKRAKYPMQIELVLVVTTDDKSLEALIRLNRFVRLAIPVSERMTSQVSKLSFSETGFDIAPNQGQLSFADITLTLETVF